MVFKTYADYYDVIYRSKKYDKECVFVLSLLKQYGLGNFKHMLDLGCGTGGHALCFASHGFQVTGVDGSQRMLGQARAKAKAMRLPIRWKLSRLERMALRTTYDVAVCLFSVIDYLLSDKNLNAFVHRVWSALRPGGLFIFDFWHAPAVIGLTPKKVRTYRMDNGVFERGSFSRLRREGSICDVQYKCRVVQDGKTTVHFSEKHRIRYFTVSEIEKILNKHGFVVKAVTPFLRPNGMVRRSTWDATVVAVKI